MDETSELLSDWGAWQADFLATCDTFATLRDAYRERVERGEEAADEGDWTHTDTFLNCLGRAAARELGAGTRGPSTESVAQLLFARQLVARLEHPPEARVRLFGTAWAPPGGGAQPLPPLAPCEEP